MLKLSAGDREKTGKIVARSFYKILRQNGFTQAEIMEVTGHILDGVIKDIKINGKDKDYSGTVSKMEVRSNSEVA